MLNSLQLRIVQLCFWLAAGWGLAHAQTTATIGTGTSSDYTYGPIYRSSAGSSFDYSRYHYIYTASELAAQGIVNGSTISSLAWYKNNTSTMDGGNATLKIHVKNSTATVATNNTWASLTGTSTQVHNGVYNTTTNLPATAGWWTIPFSSSFVYTGGSIEVSVDWDCSAVSGNPTTGSFTWLYGSAPAVLTTYANNSSLSASTTTTTNIRPNIQFTYTLPACPAPSGQVITARTFTSASVSWNAVTGAVDYNWFMVAGGAGSGGTQLASGTTTGTTLSVTSLTANTEYDFYFTTNCGSSTSLISAPFRVSTAYCTPAPSSVDGTGITRVVMGTVNNPTGAETGNYGNYTAQVVSAPAGVPLTINITYSTGYTYNTFVWVDWNDDLDFLDANEAQYVGESTSANPTTLVAALNVPAAAPQGNHRLRIGGADSGLGATTPSDPCYAGAYATFEDYTINVTAPPACLPVTVLTVSGISTSGAMLNWTVNGTETSWDIEYGPSGFTQGSGTSLTTSTKPYSLTGLNANTPYQFYVRANCGSSTSSWTGPLAFTTLCNLYTVPYFEGFESGYAQDGAIAGCLSQASVTGSSVWSANNTLTTYNRTPRTGGWNAYLAYSNEDWLFIPLTLTGGTSYTVSLYARQDGATGTDANVAISYGTTNSAAGMTNAVVAATNIVNGNYQQIVGLFTPATTGTYYVGIKGYMNGTPWYISLDDISVALTPPCAPPTALTTTSITATGASLSWTENGSAALWDIEWGTTGFTQGTGTMDTATANKPYSLSGLTFETTYQFYVRANCGGSTSPWAGPYSFYTGYCTPAPTSVDGTGITNVTVGSINKSSGAETGNYGNYSSLISPAPQGGTLPVSIALATGYTYDMWAWVDWNNDLDFADASESVFLGTSSSTNPTTFTATLPIPATAATGNHRLRIGGADSGLGTTAPSNPCYSGAYAAFEDYTLNVVVCGVSSSTTTTNVLCFGSATGAVDLTVTGATAPLSYIWSNTATAQDLTGVVAGTYSVTARDANFCVTTASATITQPASAVSAVLDSTDNVLCFGGNTGAVFTTVSGGTGAHTYGWSNGGNTADITNLVAGTYTATMTDANGCSATVSATVTGPAAALAAVIDTTINVGCFGDTTGAAYIAVSGGTTPYTYSWGSDSAINLPAGTYTNTVTDFNGCTTSVTVTVTEPTVLAGQIDSLFNIGCFGDSAGAVYLSISGGVTPYSYLWNNGSTDQDLDSLAAGTYTGTITDANGCVINANVSITQPAAALTVLLDTTNNVSCFGGSNGAINISVTGGTLVDEDTLITPLAPTNSNGGAIFDIVTTTSVTLKTFVVNTTLAAGSTYNAFMFYRSGTYIGNATSATGWNAVPVNVAVSGGPTGLTFVDLTTPLTLPAGTYGVYIGAYFPNGGGMTYTSNTTVGAAWAADANIAVLQGQGRGFASTGTEFSVGTTGTGSRCFTGVFIYETAVTPVYAWSNSAATEDLSGLNAGSYTVTVSDFNGCSTSASYTVAEPAALTNAVDSIDNVLCFGLANGNIYTTPNGGTAPYTHSWSNQASSEDLAGVGAGQYILTITDANNCTFTDTADVTQPAALVLSTDGITNVACFGGATGTISITTTGGVAPYTHLWNNGATAEDLTGLTAGAYTVAVTDSNGCTENTLIMVGGPASALSAGIQATDNACKEGATGSVDVTPIGGTPGYLVGWNTGATGSPLTGVGAGTYTATITDANGCVFSTQAMVSNTDSLPTAGGSGAITGSGEVTFTGASSANTAQVSWNFGDGNAASAAANPVHVYTANGIYAITLIASNGCGNDTFTFNVNIENVGIREDLSNQVSLYPNPTEGTFSLAFAGVNLSAATLNVYSMDGKCVVSEALGTVGGSDVRTISLDRSVVASGVYTVRVSSAEGVMVKRLVIR